MVMLTFPFGMFTEKVIKSTVLNQLPRDIAKHMAMVVPKSTNDSNRTVGLLMDDGRLFEAELLLDQMDGVATYCKLPPAFIDHLCLVV